MILTPKQQKILALFLKKGTAKSSEIHAEISKSGETVSLVTVKRALSKMADVGVLSSVGSGRSASYNISSIGRIFADVDARSYCSADPDKRYGLKKYNFDLLRSLPGKIFSDNELLDLDSATAEYKKRTEQSPQAIQKKELRWTSQISDFMLTKVIIKFTTFWFRPENGERLQPALLKFGSNFAIL